MDTFMDKLTQKLTAQEMIKANAAADAAELSRLREQTASYEAILDNIKEAGNQNASDMEKLITGAMAKIDEIKAPDASQDELKAALEEMKKLQDSQFEQLTEHVHKENVKVYRNVQAVVVEEAAKQNDSTGKQLKSLSSKMTAVMVLSIVTLLAATGGLVFQILTYLHII